MKIIHKISHHLRRGRNYHAREKWGVFAGLAVVTLLVWATSNMWYTSAPASFNTIYVQDIAKPNMVAITTPESDNIDIAAIALVDKRTNKPAAGLWVGLRIKDETLRSPKFTYFDWYSPKAERAFYPSDAQGVVYFPLQSEVGGYVTYDVFVANPDGPSSQKYQPLESRFTVEYR